MMDKVDALGGGQTAGDSSGPSPPAFACNNMSKNVMCAGAECVMCVP